MVCTILEFGPRIEIWFLYFSANGLRSVSRQLKICTSVTHFVSAKFAVLWLELIKKSVVFPLFFRLNQKVESTFHGHLGGTRARLGGFGGHWRSRGRVNWSEVGRLASNPCVVDRQRLFALDQSNHLACNEKAVAVEVAIALRVGQFPNLRQENKILLRAV